MPKPLCIYHGNCADGFGAAWVVREAYGHDDSVEFFPAVYQDPPPDVAGRNVIIVDFSYKRPVMLKILEQADSVLVLDHHKTAAEDLKGLGDGDPLVKIVFDVERSGVRIAWDYYFPNKQPLALIEHIEDRDLWRFNLVHTREIQAAIFSYPYDFKVWDNLMSLNPGVLVEEGVAIERKHHKDIAELVKVVTRRMLIGGYDVPVANLPYTLTSDAGHLLAKNEAFAGCYWDTPEGRVFSLRSVEGGIDVSAIAARYGGGGHKHASGFMVGFDRLSQFEVVGRSNG